MVLSDWKYFDGKRYYKQSVYTNKVGAEIEKKKCKGGNK